MAAILPFLRADENVFNPTDITAMSTALDDVCKALDLRDDSSAIEVMAVRIIELAKTGERSPTRLRDRVLHEAAMADRIGLDYIAPTREVDGEQQTVRVGTMANPSERNHDQVEAALFEAARELRIREKAYQLWELDGSPAGQAEHYWNLARKLIDADDAEATKTPSTG